MKKAIGGFILGTVFGWFCMSNEKIKIKIKRCQTKVRKLLNLAMIFYKLN